MMKVPVSATTFKNTILQRLDPETLQRLALTFTEFKLGHELEFPGKPIRQLAFVEEGMASMTTTFSDGFQVEVGMFGYESVLGISALMGTIRSLNRVYTQVEGHGYTVPLDRARAEFVRGGTFQHLCLHYVQAQLVQAMQSAGCNARHHLEQRLARWLLTTADRVHHLTFALSQEFMADMVGNTRPTVSRTAAVLKSEGLIDYTRGIITILDPAGLRKRSCECYAVIKQHLENVKDFEERNIR